MNFNIGSYNVKHDELNMTWDIFWRDKKVGEFKYKEDSSGKIWAWNFFIDEEHQKKGIGSILIKKGVEYYGTVYFFTGTRLDLKRISEWDYDSRYLTEEGATLLNSCIRKGIIKKEWAINPFEDKGDF